MVLIPANLTDAQLSLKPMNPLLSPGFSAPAVVKPVQASLRLFPPKRRYLWALQEVILLQLLGGASLNAVAKQVRPSRKTIKRWFDRLKSRFALDAAALRNRFAELGRCDGVSEFWQTCLTKMSLASAMFHIHDSGTFIP
jgi:hypothetical protein